MALVYRSQSEGESERERERERYGERHGSTVTCIVYDSDFPIDVSPLAHNLSTAGLQPEKERERETERERERKKERKKER